MHKFSAETRTAIGTVAILALMFSVIPLTNFAQAYPTAITVPDDYPTIQAAINAANIGSTIFVRNGLYQENIVVDKVLTLQGENREATVINGSFVNSVVTITADGVVFSDFKIIGGGANGIYIKQTSGTTIKNNLVDSSRSSACFALNFECSNHNSIINNRMIRSFEGCVLNNSDSNIILNNVMEDNVENLWMLLSDHNYVDNNKLSQTSGFASIYMVSCYSNMFRRNQISSCQHNGVYLGENSEKNLFTENNFQQNNQDLLISYCAYNTFTHNNFYTPSIDNQDCLNAWNDTQEGNYWGDYVGDGATPYEINSSYPIGSLLRHSYGRDFDYHPLLSPVNVVYPEDLQTILVSPQNTSYTTDNVTFTIVASNALSGVTYKLDGEFGVFYQNTSLPWLTNGTHALTTYATNLEGAFVPIDTVTFGVHAVIDQTKPPVERIYNYNWSPPFPASPQLTILLPMQGQIIDTHSVTLSFIVTEWENYTAMATRINRVQYAIDPVYNPMWGYSGWIQIPVSQGDALTKTYSVSLSNVANGTHTLMVLVEATSHLSPSMEVVVHNSTQVSFVVNASSSNTNQGSSSVSSSSSTTSSSHNQPTTAPTITPKPSAAPTTNTSTTTPTTSPLEANPEHSNLLLPIGIVSVSIPTASAIVLIILRYKKSKDTLP